MFPLSQRSTNKHLCTQNYRPCRYLACPGAQRTKKCTFLCDKTDVVSPTGRYLRLTSCLMCASSPCTRPFPSTSRENLSLANNLALNLQILDLDWLIPGQFNGREIYNTTTQTGARAASFQAVGSRASAQVVNMFMNLKINAMKILVTVDL